MGQGYIGGIGGVSVAPSTSGNVMTSNGTIWTSAAAAKARVLADIIAGTFTDSGGSGAFAQSYGTAPIAGSYKLVTTIKVSALGGAGPSDFMLYSPAVKKIYIYNPATNTRTQLYAANVLIATVAKGSDFVAGDTYVASSSAFTLAAGEGIVNETSGTPMFRYFTDSANTVTAEVTTELVLQ